MAIILLVMDSIWLEKNWRFRRSGMEEDKSYVAGTLVWYCFTQLSQAGVAKKRDNGADAPRI